VLLEIVLANAARRDRRSIGTHDQSFDAEMSARGKSSASGYASPVVFDDSVDFG